MARAPFNVLFRHTGNSARSILAESPLNHSGQGRSLDRMSLARQAEEIGRIERQTP